MNVAFGDKRARRSSGLRQLLRNCHLMTLVIRNPPTSWVPPFDKKQATGIEPASSAWEADILPMYYACIKTTTSILYKVAVKNSIAN